MDIEEALTRVLHENVVVARHAWRRDFVYRFSERMGGVAVHQWRCTRVIDNEDAQAEDWEILGSVH